MFDANFNARFKTTIKIPRVPNLELLYCYTAEERHILYTRACILVFSYMGRGRGSVLLKQLTSPGGGHFNFVCTGECGHTIGKLTHPQTKAGLSISRNRPIPRLCTIKHEPKLTKLQQVSFYVAKTTHSQVELLKWRPV